MIHLGRTNFSGSNFEKDSEFESTLEQDLGFLGSN